MIKGLLSVVVGLALGLMVTLFVGESPIHVAVILAQSSFGSLENFGMTLFYATPLMFTGLSVAFAFHGGLFNIGAEGQLTFGALAAAAVGILCPGLPWPMAPITAGLAAFLAGALWGGVPGYLKARRGAHEVITTIMLNFIAAAFSSWVTLYLLKNPDTQNPETLPVAPQYLLKHFTGFGDAPLSSALFLAFAVALAVGFFLWRTVLGFQIRALGSNERAVEEAGISSGRLKILVMSISGGLAGLVGVTEVLGNAGKFKMGFSPDYGFIGIAVALLGRNRPLGVLAAALLFGALHKGTTDLDLETERVTRDLSLVLQALVILVVAADAFWDRLFMKRRVA